ncbi:response regulator [Erythrobacter sp.]|jgi:two-component system chemotaxis response regulator CheB|uniref:response regulator n=1 Tax=Erythrobacter sp. TaxID=1042 RepID=UPI002EBBD7B6|nr:response regulator [Erythrobacter sp.]
MPDVKVMVVDDSAAMRALFCDILENAKGIDVCATAANADEAREKLESAKPDVLTLDVEMPGTSGMELLEEIMAERPMPVVMLSSITQEGTGTAQRALDLGAAHCFPKPLNTSQDVFSETVAKLGDIVRKAAAGELPAKGADNDDGGDGGGAGGGGVVALACGEAGLDYAKHMVAGLTSECPPTVLLIDADADAVEACFASAKGAVACEIVEGSDGVALKPGRVVLVHRKSHHATIEGGEVPRLKEVERDPVNGARPSADLLFGSLAKAGGAGVAGLFVGTGSDGARGLKMLGDAGARIFVQQPADFEPSDRLDAVKTQEVDAEVIDKGAILEWIDGRAAVAA